MALGFMKARKIEKEYAAMHAAFLHDDYEEAEKMWHEILEKSEWHVKTMMLIAQMAWNQEHFKKSREWYGKVIHDHPANKDARLWRAKCAYELFNFEDALDDYLTLYETSFKTTDYLVSLWDTYQKLNLHVIALRYYEKAVKQSPDHIKGHVGLGYQYLIMWFYKRAKEEAELAKDLYYKHKYEYDTNVVDNIFWLEEQVSLLTKDDDEKPVKKTRKKRTPSKKTTRKRKTTPKK